MLGIVGKTTVCYERAVYDLINRPVKLALPGALCRPLPSAIYKEKAKREASVITYLRP